MSRGGRAFLVTASGTEIGKTFVTAGLARAFAASGARVAVRKPVMSGYDPDDPAGSDAGLLLAAIGATADAAGIDAISPWRFRAPLSPDMAAAREGRRIEFEALVRFCGEAVTTAPDVLLIEGVGGIMAPVGERHTMLDLAARLALPAILVGGTHLGAISHVLTAHLALASRGVPVARVVLSESESSPVPPRETAATIARLLGGAPVAIVARHRSAHDRVNDFASLAGVLDGG